MILDTNAVSAMAAKNQHLLAKLSHAPRLCITLISLGEYEFGIAHSRQKTSLQRWLNAFLDRAEVLNPNQQTLPHYVAIRSELKQAGAPIPANDVWIAALVRQHRMPLLSLDHHFDVVNDVTRIGW